jgi:DNA polymerase III delta prime subunit
MLFYGPPGTGKTSEFYRIRLDLTHDLLEADQVDGFICFLPIGTILALARQMFGYVPIPSHFDRWVIFQLISYLL